MAGGWVQISRKLLEWQWHDEPNMVVVWIYMLLSANYEQKQWHGMTIQRGQFVSTIGSICTQTGLSARNVRTCIQRLVDDGSIMTESTNKMTLFTILSYDEYQNDSKTQNDKPNSDTNNSNSDNYNNNNFANDRRTQNSRQANDEQNSEKTTNENLTKQTQNQEVTSATNSEATNERQERTVKNDNNIINNNNNSSSSPTYAREETEREKLKALFSDTRVQQLIVSRTEMNIENATAYIDEFANQCEVRGVRHKDDIDLAEHFTNWLQIKTKKYLTDAANNQNTAAGNNNKPDRDEQRNARVSSVFQEAMRLISTGREGD